MKSLIITLLVLMPTITFAQDYEYEVTVIDSFTCYQFDQQGATAIRSVEYNGSIHLSYIMQDTTGVFNLMYAIKNQDGITFEIIGELPGDLLWGSAPGTAIQFDENGDPHIYVGYLRNPIGPDQRAIYWYRKQENSWVGSKVANSGFWPYLAADVDGSNGLGFVFWSPSDNFFDGNITYASFNGSNWDFETISTNEVAPKTRPSIVNFNNKTYISFGEGHYPDSLISYVYLKENNSWSLDYKDVNLTTYNGGGVNGLYTVLGKSQQGLHLLTTLRYENSNPYYLKNEGQGWQVQNISYDASLTSPGINSPNLNFDTENNAYWLNSSAGSKRLSWIKDNGEGGTIGLPYFYSAKILHDFTIIDDEAYIYFFEGNSGYPFGTPVTFKEIKIDLNQFTTNIAELEDYLGIKLQQNYPNPFNNSTTIEFKIEQTANVNLSLYNSIGQEIRTIVNEKRALGEYKETIRADGLSEGIYSYVLKVNGRSISRKMVVTR